MSKLLTFTASFSVETGSLDIIQTIVMFENVNGIKKIKTFLVLLFPV
jgi:hypothetical protein